MIRLLSAILAVLLPAAVAAAPVRAPVDLSRTASRNPDGSITVGNPRAPVKLVELLDAVGAHAPPLGEDGNGDTPTRRRWAPTPSKQGSPRRSMPCSRR